MVEPHFLSLKNPSFCPVHKVLLYFSMPMDLFEKRIGVIGGGLGGLAFMNPAIHAQLPNVHLYEAAPQFAEVGAGVNITRNAKRVLDMLGVGQDMMRKSSHEQYSYMEYRHHRTGEYLGHIDEFGEPHSRVIHRAHLLDCLKTSPRRECH